MMDAVEFLREKERMCRSFNDDCKNKDGNNFYCGLRYEANKSGESCEEYISNHPAEAVKIVEKWSKEHPKKTRQSELLKLFPRVDMTADGVIAFCPESMDSTFVCPIKERDRYDPECGDCRKKYWLEEVEDDDGD